jgi:hypothetical protein
VAPLSSVYNSYVTFCVDTGRIRNIRMIVVMIKYSTGLNI